MNSEAYGAPAVLFCYLDQTLGPGQWADAGIYLQTVMLLLRVEGLHGCPQVMWTAYRETVNRAVGADDGLVLFCGVSVGFETEGVPQLLTGRAEDATDEVQRALAYTLETTPLIFNSGDSHVQQVIAETIELTSRVAALAARGGAEQGLSAELLGFINSEVAK